VVLDDIDNHAPPDLLLSFAVFHALILYSHSASGRGGDKGKESEVVGVEGAGEVSVEAVKEGSTFSRESVDPCARALLVYICPFIVSSSHIKNYTIRHSTYTTMTHVARFLAVSDTSLPRSYYTPLPYPDCTPILAGPRV